jgi:hypothetical protein
VLESPVNTNIRRIVNARVNNNVGRIVKHGRTVDPDYHPWATVAGLTAAAGGATAVIGSAAAPTPPEPDVGGPDGHRPRTAHEGQQQPQARASSRGLPRPRMPRLPARVGNVAQDRAGTSTPVAT